MTYTICGCWHLNLMPLKSHKSFLLLKLELNQNLCSWYLHSVIFMRMKVMSDNVCENNGHVIVVSHWMPSNSLIVVITKFVECRSWKGFYHSLALLVAAGLHLYKNCHLLLLVSMGYYIMHRLILLEILSRREERAISAGRMILLMILPSVKIGLGFLSEAEFNW